MERTFRHHKSHRTRILLTDLCGRTRSPQLLEHRTSSKVLPISCQKASSWISNFNKGTWSFEVQFKHPRQLQESLLLRLPRIPTFLCSLKVKGTANRVVGAFGPRDKFSILSSIRRPNRLLRYLIFEWDQLPILLIHEMTTYSTTAVLKFRMGPAPYSPRP